MNPAKLVTVSIVNWMTRGFTQQCIESIQRFYPDVPIIMIDNGSCDPSLLFVASCSNVIRILNPTNIGHGPAMDQVMRLAQTSYVFTFDSDCEMMGEGLLELLLEQVNGVYAAGLLVNVDNNGRNVRSKKALLSTAYIHPRAAMFDRKRYFKLEPFSDHGAPCIQNMQSAQYHDFTLVDVPEIEEYFVHEKRGSWPPDYQTKPTISFMRDDTRAGVKK